MDPLDSTPEIFPPDEGASDGADPSTESPATADPSGGAAPAPQSGGAIDQQRLAAVLTHLDGRLAQLEGAVIQQRQAPAAPAATEPAQPAFQQLYSDPEAYVRRVAEDTAKSTLGAIPDDTNFALEQIAKYNVRSQRSEFDRSWGAGAWDELVDGDGSLSTAMTRLPVKYRASDDHLRALVAGIMGGHMQHPDGQKRLRDRIKRTSAERPQAPLMLGGDRPSPPADSLSGDEKSFVGELNRAGIKFSEKDYLDARNRGPSEEDWGASWMRDPLETPPAKPNGGSR